MMKKLIDMMEKVFKYVLIGVLLLAGLMLLCPKFRNALPAMHAAVSGSVVDKMESRLDQGTLALVRFDEEYTKAEQKLIALRHLRLDAQYNMQKAQETAARYRNQGKEELARRNDEQVAFYENQLTGYDVSIGKRSEKLRELKQLRELAREDVRLARERIAMLHATREAMDTGAQEEMLEKAQMSINSLQSHCNRLHAEIEVLKLSE